ncbi:MAG: hypothetical protein GY871_04020 [Actinomycetales bacterium]|nr:hypothetical protein [Actinomycetales bacterium]
MSDSSQQPKQAVSTGRMGTRQAIVRKGGCTMAFPIYSAKLYELRPRQSDGAMTWRFVEHLTEGHTGYKTTEARAVALAEERGLPYEPGLLYGQIYNEGASA